MNNTSPISRNNEMVKKGEIDDVWSRPCRMRDMLFIARLSLPMLFTSVWVIASGGSLLSLLLFVIILVHDAPIGAAVYKRRHYTNRIVHDRDRGVFILFAKELVAHLPLHRVRSLAYTAGTSFSGVMRFLFRADILPLEILVIEFDDGVKKFVCNCDPETARELRGALPDAWDGKGTPSAAES